jgi:hypothetical protein
MILSFLKYATEGRFWPFRRIFSRIASTIRLTNFENSNANIFYLPSSFLNRRVKMIKQLEDRAAIRTM